MIKVAGVSKRFGAIVALSDVSFTVNRGSVVGLLGVNGAGKSTILDIICGCRAADEGSVTVAGFDILDQAFEAKKRIGFLPDVLPIYPEMRVIDYVKYAATLRRVPPKEASRRVDDTLARLGLSSVAHRLIGNLSKGYRQRAALAQALVHDPEVLVLDEPTEGLDPLQIIQFRELIRSLAQHSTIIMSSHHLQEVKNLCETVVIIDAGRVIMADTWDKLLRQHNFASIYKLTVFHNAQQLVDQLTKVSGVSSSSLDPNDGRVKFAVNFETAEHSLNEVMRTVVDGGFGVKELVFESDSLEETFSKLRDKSRA